MIVKISRKVKWLTNFSIGGEGKRSQPNQKRGRKVCLKKERRTIADNLFARSRKGGEKLPIPKSFPTLKGSFNENGGEYTRRGGENNSSKGG